MLSPLGLYLRCFLVGGGICVLGQLLISLTRLTSGRILVLFVSAGVLLTALGLYEPLLDFAGAGASVPITGFGYTLCKGALEAVAEKGVLGAFMGGTAAAGAGIGAAVLFGYLCALLFTPRVK